MIRPRKNIIIHWFFHHYILWIVARNFHEVKLTPVNIAPEKAVLLLANHFSWWDGFLMYYLNSKLLSKKFHVMILEDTAREVSFFKYMGAFSVNKNSKDMMASLDYAAGLLNDHQNMVLIFPQGKLHSNFTDNMIFQKGLMRIINGARADFQILMAATFIEHFKYKKPSAHVYLKTLTSGLTYKNIDELTAVYQQYYNLAKQQQTEIVL
ncbi:lysophospholipid acyltransferase family protein [Mucilaginibacter sabulilitoris]|uniref:Lysophospholipid acyltransferase family protein n=1 Tax=Mucilaginibacter sabulilitoris TaxID=1173583 RepID=A0ABZ0TN82_9SPHI|nr:lysophospholipid acyltransferase family protein [Mucilaginibacter sabulilitoris]WPU93892.1 lysophospholipid acyltransferase family protein [Mucilaginibacter sabulilitoris]